MPYKLLKKDSITKARLGTLTTAHGEIQTPFFMPVGTNATVKGLSSEELLGMNSQIILSNTYHLYLRPGTDIIALAKGLHHFIGWDKPILTDSGGYQVFSLAKLRKIADDGVEFQSHVDGSTHFFTPEKVIEIENILGSDIIMPLDECAPYPCDHAHAQKALYRTSLWAERSKKYFTEHPLSRYRQLLFGIIQGAHYPDLRARSREEILEIGFDGYAIGGVSVGEPVEMMFDTLGWVIPYLPENFPRYFMGIGLPDQIVRAVGEGIDMFDTCIPTRYGRHGSAFTSRGRVVVRNGEFAKDMTPLDSDCQCFVCRKYTRSYLRHLVNTGEITGIRMVSYHNVYFYVKLMEKIRQAIAEERYAEFQKIFLTLYTAESVGK